MFNKKSNYLIILLLLLLGYSAFPSLAKNIPKKVEMDAPEQVVATSGPTTENTQIVRYSDSHNTFNGWEFFIDESTQMAMGYPKDGATNGVIKAQPIDPINPQPWNLQEYYCDPDTVIAVSSSKRYETAYLSYLNMEKDSFLRDDKKFARISYRYNPSQGIDPRFSAIQNSYPLKLDIRTDTTLEAGKSWLQTTVYLTNRYPEAVSLLYVYQDAAYMWFPDQNQINVKPMLVNNLGQWSSDKYYFGANTTGKLIASTYHTQKGVNAGIMTTNKYAYSGVIPEYALFRRHQQKSGFPYGYAEMDNTKRTFTEILNNLSRWNGREGSTAQLKVRVVAFPIANLEPGKTVAIQYYQYGIKDLPNGFDNQLKSISAVTNPLMQK